jgi:hypothetical protein
MIMSTARSDPSLRYVLPGESPLLANLAALWAVAPELARQLESIDDALDYPVEKSRGGDLTLAVPTEQNRPLYLHSRYQPIDEATKLIDAINLDDNVVFYVHGFGLGYHVQLLFERSSEESLIFIFEPDVRVLKTAMGQFDFAKMIESRRVTFFTRTDKGEIFVKLTPNTAMISTGAVTVRNAGSVQRHKSTFEQIDRWLEEYAAFGHTCMNTLVINGRKTAENLAKNIGWYVAAPDIAGLKDRHAGKPAIIVSAGPSLRKNKHLLKQASEHAIIIAVQTTLQPLLEMGIEPDYVTSLDYHEICTRFFEKLPKTLRTELVAEPKATSLIFDLNPGPLWLLGNPFIDSLLKEMKLARGGLQSGATVAHLAFYLAEHVGCEPIVFVGQDLGFSDGLCYTPGTSYEDVWRPELGRFCTVETKQWEQIVRDKSILRRIPDYARNPMYTEERLYAYLQQFERDFLQTDRTVIDATEGGAFKRGSLPLPLATALEQHCGPRIQRPETTHPGLKWDRLPEALACLERRSAEAAEVETISRQTLPLLEEVRDHLDDQARVNRVIGQVDLLRRRMNQFDDCYQLITQMTQNTELDRFKADRKIAASKLTGTEKQRRQVGRDVENVRGVLEAAKEFQKLMAAVSERLAADLKHRQPEAA